MRLITLTPKRTRHGGRPPQQIAYICEVCAADYGITVPENVEHMEVSTLLHSEDGRGRTITHECSHPAHEDEAMFT